MELSPHKIKDKLLKALDKDDNVLDMAAVTEVLALLEKISVSKDLLEETRLGKHINGLRKKTKDKALASRAKSLVRRWRDFILPEHNQNSVNGDKNAVKIRSNLNGNDRNVKAMTNRNRASNSTTLSFTSKPNSPLRISEKCVSPCGISFSSASNSPSSSLHHAKGFLSGISSPIIKSRPFEGIGKNDNASCVGFKPISPAMNVANNSSSSIKQPLTSPAKSISQNSIDGRSRSPLVKNFDVRSPISKIVSPLSQTLHSTLDLDRTNAANKRLRKENDFDCSTPEPKKFCKSVNSNTSLVNGISDNQHSVKQLTPVSHNIVPSSSSVKRSRKKKSDDKPEPMESFRKKLAVAKTQKVKTTAQLIASLHMNNSPLLKSSDTTISNNQKAENNTSKSIDKSSLKYSAFTDDSAEVKKSKSDLLEKFLSSSPSSPLLETRNDGHMQLQKESPNTSLPPLLEQEEQHSVGDSPNVPHKYSFSDKLNNILSQLPPINPSEIQWDDDNDNVQPKTTVLNEESLIKLEREKWPEVNGNFSNEAQWSSWSETVFKNSYEDEPIVILPYVNID